MYIAREIGFKLPDTLITNDSKEASSFNSTSSSGCIIKPLKAGKIDHGKFCDIFNTNMINSKECITNIDNSPLFMQQFVEKDYELRVTFINGYSYAVRIDADDKVDWRMSDDKNIYTLVSIDKEIILKCKKFLEYYDLSFGAFDFIVHKGEYIFLENNPNGQWLWLEEDLGLDISDRIIDYLVGVEHE